MTTRQRPCIAVIGADHPWVASGFGAREHQRSVTGLRWEPCGRRLLSGDAGGRACLWSMRGHLANTWECVLSVDYGAGEGICALAWLTPVALLAAPGDRAAASAACCAEPATGGTPATAEMTPDAAGAPFVTAHATKAAPSAGLLHLGPLLDPRMGVAVSGWIAITSSGRAHLTYLDAAQTPRTLSAALWRTPFAVALADAALAADGRCHVAVCPALTNAQPRPVVRLFAISVRPSDGVPSAPQPETSTAAWRLCVVPLGSIECAGSMLPADDADGPLIDVGLRPSSSAPSPAVSVGRSPSSWATEATTPRERPRRACAAEAPTCGPAARLVALLLDRSFAEPGERLITCCVVDRDAATVAESWVLSAGREAVECGGGGGSGACSWPRLAMGAPHWAREARVVVPQRILTAASMSRHGTAAEGARVALCFHDGRVEVRDARRLRVCWSIDMAASPAALGTPPLGSTGVPEATPAADDPLPSARPADGADPVATAAGTAVAADATPGFTAMCFSPCDVGLVLADAVAGIRMLTGPLSDPSQLAHWLEYCLFDNRDWWDLLIMWRVLMRNTGFPSSHLDLVALSLRRNVASQPPGDRRRYLLAYLSLIAALFRHVPDRLARSVDADAYMIMEFIVDAFETALYPREPADVWPPEHLAMLLLHDGGADAPALLARIRDGHFAFAERLVHALQPLAEWAINLAVFAVKNLYHYAFGCPSDDGHVVQANVPSVSLMEDLDALLALRKLIIYVLLLRRQCEAPAGSCYVSATRLAGDALPLLYALLTSLWLRCQPVGLVSDADCDRLARGQVLHPCDLRAILQRFPLPDCLHHPMFEHRILMRRLQVCSRADGVLDHLIERGEHACPPPGTRRSPLDSGAALLSYTIQPDLTYLVDVGMVRHKPASESSVSLRFLSGTPVEPTPYPMDLLQQTVLSPSIPLRTCMRCGRTTIREGQPDPYAVIRSKWTGACICGGLWRACSPLEPDTDGTKTGVRATR